VTAHLRHARTSGERLAEPDEQNPADALGVLHETFFLDRGKRREGCRAGERIAAERGAVSSRFEDRGRGSAGEAGSDRHARREALGEQHDVGLNPGVLIDEPLARAAQPALDFVHHEQPTLAVAKLAQIAQVPHRGDIDSAFALDRLDQHRDDALVARSDLPHRFDVVERHTHEARHQGFESLLHFAVAGGRERRERSPVESLVHDHDPGALHPLAVAVQARELDRGFVGFTARVAEEHAVGAAYCRELVRESFLFGDAVEVGGVDQTRALLRDRPGEFRVTVAERVDRDSRKRIEVPLAGFVPHPHALAAGKGNRNPAVCVHRMRHGITRQCLRRSETLAPKSLWNAP